jgi:hypothetical protein
MQNLTRITTKESLKQDVDFIELTEQGKEQEWLSILLKQCDRETSLWLIEKEIIRTWSDLKKLVKNLKETSDLNKLAKILCDQRKYDENIENYFKNLRNKLMAFDLTEDTIISIISNNIWPGDTQTITQLKNAKNVENLSNMIIIEEERRARKQKIYCTNCKRNGHLTTQCRNTTPKQNL